jgi:DNA-binding transcriptional regulator LsrR (DeoR family)
MPAPLYSEDERLRRIHRVLVMLYQEHRSQSEIATALGISPATVNRMVREGHDRGLVEIRIRAPFGTEAELAERLKAVGRLEGAVVVQSGSSDPAIVLRAVAEAAANAFLEGLEDGQTIAVSGGVALSAVVEALETKRTYDVRVVPAIGGVQGKFRTDVNHVAVALAEKLGGTAIQLHAPVFAATEAEREALLALSSVRKVLDEARRAEIALFGIGSVREVDSTYLTLEASIDRQAIETSGARSELLAHLLDATGAVCDHPSNRRLVGLTLEEFAAIPRRLGVASGARKVEPIAAILRGGAAGILVTDDGTAQAVLEKLEGSRNASTS